MITIVFCHPWHGSFNYAILEVVTGRFDVCQTPYQVIDLVADGFDPVMRADDLRLYGRGESFDPLVGKYGRILRESDGLILIFPIWWGTMPAILNGFFDKVLLKGCAMDYSSDGTMVPLLQINRTLIITTSQGPTSLYRTAIEDGLAGYLLKSVGIGGAEWYNCDKAAHGPAEHRAEFLLSVAEEVGRLWPGPLKI